MVDCGWVFKRLFSYLDKDVPLLGGPQMEEHFEFCRSCYLEMEFGIFLKKMIRQIDGSDCAPEHLRRELSLKLT